MERLGSYVLTVTAAAILAGILSSFLDKNTTSGALVKMAAGLFLLFAVLGPVAGWNPANLTDFTAGLTSDGDQAAAEGENLAREAMGDIIKSEAEAYILDKASVYRADLTVQIELAQQNSIPVPESVTIEGRISPYAKMQLQQLIEEQLGISKENQQWIGS